MDVLRNQHSPFESTCSSSSKKCLSDFMRHDRNFKFQQTMQHLYIAEQLDDCVNFFVNVHFY